MCSTRLAVPVASNMAPRASCCRNFAATASRITATFADSQSRRSFRRRSRPNRAASIAVLAARTASRCFGSSNFWAWK